MFSVNPILATDSYKVSHYKQYPPGTKRVFSYFESRGRSERFKQMGIPEHTVFFAALNYYLTDALRPVTREDLREAQEITEAHFGVPMLNSAGWEHIITHYKGRLPLRIRAVPEGTVVPSHNVLFTVENTDPNVPWLTNWMETRLAEMWYPITVATLSRHCRNIILKFLKETGDPALIDFKLHDFGFRGASSMESAAIGGLAHLVNFKGTDTIAALALAKQYYRTSCAGFSIPAAEHSTITSWGKEHEVDAFRNMLTQYPEGLVAVVSDSYDIYAACEHLWGELLRDDVLKRNGTVVIRPDSGNPVIVVPNVLNILGSKFGYTTNSKGFKVLDPHVRVIQGDGVNPKSIAEILMACQLAGWSADNLAFGMGGALLQSVNRDDLKFAFKCSHVSGSFGSRDVWKSPVTDPGKMSKMGRITLYRDGANHFYTALEGGSPSGTDAMQTVLTNGVLWNNTETLDTIRERANDTDSH